MHNIPKHKVFISYYHQDDQYYKDKLLEINERYNLFKDCSVHENEIEDDNLKTETIRKIIRDEYMQDATVLILLCGKNTKSRKHIDWEIHTAMFDTEKNPKIGILVINLPSSTNTQRSCGQDDKQFFSPYVNWIPLGHSKDEIEKSYPDLPSRVVENFMKEDVKISVVDWETIEEDFSRLKGFIHNAFQRRKNNNYDHSTPLRRNNS